jgi:hypothetical protein
MRSLLSRAVLALTAAGGLALAVAATPDPVIGSWQLNVAKSKFTSGPALKSQTRTYSQSGDSITVVIKSVGADGKETSMQTTYKLDGKDYPVTGAPGWDTLSGKQLDSNTAEFTLKKGGKVVGRTGRTVSKDGKTLMSRQSTVNEKGEKYEAELVLDKK